MAFFRRSAVLLGGWLAAATFAFVAPAGAQAVYQTPQVNGAVVDWCESWATNCGAGGAHQYCRVRGHSGAVSWNVYRPGRTWVIGSNRFCDGDVCQGFSQVTCAAGGTPTGPGQSTTFQNPVVNGAVVDWCATWATDCGAGGAHQFCRTQQYSQAASWAVYRPGRTWVIGSSRFCDGQVCQGFSQVVCVR